MRCSDYLDSPLDDEESGKFGNYGRWCDDDGEANYEGNQGDESRAVKYQDRERLLIQLPDMLDQVVNEEGQEDAVDHDSNRLEADDYGALGVVEGFVLGIVTASL